MTRFEMEISGKLDREVAERTGESNKHFWQRHAEKEMYEAVEKFHSDIDVDENGIATWKKSGNVVPSDFLEKLDWAGVATINYEATRAEEKRRNAEFFKAYREQRKNHKYSEEELFEMRAAFGTGVTIVDAISGQEIRL